MLNKFRTHHIKRILWAMLVVIIPSFVLWGGIAYLKGKNAETFVRIGNRALTLSDFKYYLSMAQYLAISGFDVITVSLDKK